MSFGSPGGDRPHYRRTRVNGPNASPRSRRPWIVVVGVGLGLLASVAALAVGSFVIGTFGSVPPQSSAGGIPNAPTGVSFVQAEAVLVNSTTVPATGNCSARNFGNLTSPTLLSNGNSTTVCLSANVGGYQTGDLAYTLEVAWSSAAANATIFKIQVSIDTTPVSHDANATVYLKTSTHITATEYAVFAVDLTQQVDTAATSFNILVTEL